MQIYQGDAAEVLKTMPAGSINCCVTSPPYYGLRDYGVVGQIGLEETPEAYVARLVDVFREVRRVLRDDGTLWLNLGDSYAAQRGSQPAPTNTRNKTGHVDGPRAGLKPKDLIGIPWRVAFALQADGWYLRQDIIWHKPNPMPESVKDRCTKSHEYLFLLSKSEKYYFDADAVKEPAVCAGKFAKNDGAAGMNFNMDGNRTRAGLGKGMVVAETRNKRSVWTIATRPYKEAHFAVFPPALVLPCVLAGCPAGGTVLDPFAGSGTTLQVAMENGRDGIGIELNPEYIKLMQKRIGVFSAC